MVHSLSSHSFNQSFPPDSPPKDPSRQVSLRCPKETRWDLKELRSCLLLRRRSSLGKLVRRVPMLCCLVSLSIRFPCSRLVGARNPSLGLFRNFAFSEFMSTSRTKQNELISEYFCSSFSIDSGSTTMSPLPSFKAPLGLLVTLKQKSWDL